MKVDEGIAFGALSLMVVETIKVYQDSAPTLRDLRCAPPGDGESLQLLLDADILGLIVVVALGGGGALLIRRMYPLILAAIALLLISAYYRSVLRSVNNVRKGE